MSKKGQVEMIGLVIVVILIVFGLLLYIKFGILRKDETKKDSSLELAYVNNLMISIFNLKVCEENPLKIEDVLVKCFEFSNDEICGERSACDYAKQEIGKIMADFSFKDYRKTSISVEKGGQVVEITNDCEFGVNSYTTIVTADNEYYTANFKVC